MGMELIQHVTIGSGGAASINFASIAADFTDLMLVLSSRSSTNGVVDDPVVTFNNSTSNFSGRRMYGDGSGRTSTLTTRFIANTSANSATSSTFGSASLYIPNYASGNFKSFSGDGVSENNATTAYQSIVAGLWSQTAAISTITITLGSNTFSQYSTASLYGII
jgi:hypothetical protein